MPTKDSGSDWDAKFKGFLQKAGDDFKRAAVDVKNEAERLMKEAQDPARQARVRSGVKEASLWAKKTAEQLATLVEEGVKQAEVALTDVAKQFNQPGAGAAPHSGATATPAPTPKNAAPPEMAPAPPPAPKKPARKTVGRGAAKKSSAPTRAPSKKKALGKKKAAKPEGEPANASKPTNEA